MRIGYALSSSSDCWPARRRRSAVLPDVRGALGLGPPSTSTTGRALIGGPFTLTDHTGQRVTEKDFAGRPMVVFFGFTNCPDVCPVGIAGALGRPRQARPDKGDQVAPLFISVDPERDTPERLAPYVQSFHPRLVGLTGTPEEVENAAEGLSRLFQEGEDRRLDGGLHHRPLGDHLHHGRGGAYSLPTPRTPPRPTSSPS